jgi:hypothetical protein
METEYGGRQVVGMDLHLRWSVLVLVLVRMTEDGRRLGTARIANSPAELRAQIARAGKSERYPLIDCTVRPPGTPQRLPGSCWPGAARWPARSAMSSGCWPGR